MSALKGALAHFILSDNLAMRFCSHFSWWVLGPEHWAIDTCWSLHPGEWKVAEERAEA